jgi:pantoate--beta-alanine ligase
VRVARTIDEVRTALSAERGGRTVGLVPTMGALHAGHLSLVAAARAECAVVVASVFVNPQQFGPGEDLSRYPRDEVGDLRLLEEAGVDVAFLPSVAEMYPPGFQTFVDVAGISTGLEGAARPGHFRGVATVCLKLFSIVRPDVAYFGQKDAQQAEVVGQMARDLALGVRLRILPTVRDADGLALSSRNAYLSAEEREAALALPRALAAGEEAFRAGDDPAEAARAVLADEPRLAPDYVQVAQWNGHTVLAAAVRAGSTRLIDNVLLEGSWNP